jgi:hypothetical protein
VREPKKKDNEITLLASTLFKSVVQVYYIDYEGCYCLDSFHDVFVMSTYRGEGLTVRVRCHISIRGAQDRFLRYVIPEKVMKKRLEVFVFWWFCVFTVVLIRKLCAKYVQYGAVP